MSKRDIYDVVKRATVGIVMGMPERLPKRPFTIIGTGFCVHRAGIVVTCEHVFRAFFEQGVYEKLMKEVMGNKGEIRPIREKHVTPSVLFLGGISPPNVYMYQVGITDAVTKTDYDLAIFKLSAHAAFPNGYPTLKIADYDTLHEMAEIGTCGFPLGDSLHDQMGTVSSSFTTGRISSIIPVAGVPKEHLKGFQLDLTATNGNSGGPVFSLETGDVFGVLQAGATHPKTQTAVQGLTRAEPVYPALDHDLVEGLLSGSHRPPGF